MVVYTVCIRYCNAFFNGSHQGITLHVRTLLDRAESVLDQSRSRSDSSSLDTLRYYCYTSFYNILETVNDGANEYFVFGSWSGGYLDGDSWRRNSGITKVETDGDDYLFYGYSGSVYRCSKHSEGRISGYNAGVLNRICEISEAYTIPVQEFEKRFK